MAPRQYLQGADFLGPYLGRIILREREKSSQQKKLAKKIGISDTTLRRVESGKGHMSPQRISDICQAMGLSFFAVVNEALLAFWLDLNQSARESGCEGVEPSRQLRQRILDRFDAGVREHRAQIEAELDYQDYLSQESQREKQAE